MQPDPIPGTIWRTIAYNIAVRVERVDTGQVTYSLWSHHSGSGEIYTVDLTRFLDCFEPLE